MSESTRVGLVTSDPAVVDALRRALVGTRRKLVVASDAAAAQALLDSSDAAAIVVDFAAKRVVGPLVRLPMRADALLFMHPAGPTQRPLLAAFDRDELPRLAARLRQLFSDAEATLSATFIGGEQMAALRKQLVKVARFDAVNVLVSGAPGTGKSLAARAIAELVGGPEAPLVSVECASVAGAASSLESSLEAARGGVLLLREVGALSPARQSALLALLDGKRPVSARVVSTTSAPESALLRLRRDLLERLDGYRVAIPPLAERTADVPALAAHFLESLGARGSLRISLTKEAEAELAGRPWPGNVKELRATVEHAAISIAPRDSITPEDLPPPRAPAPLAGAVVRPLREAQRELVLAALRHNGGNVSRAARQLRVSRSTLRDMVKRYNSASFDE